MVFNDYCQKIKLLLKNKVHVDALIDHNINQIFKDYINDIPIKECCKHLTIKQCNENTKKIDNTYIKYYKRVISLLETYGYNKNDITKTVDKEISDTYDIEEDEYACSELCKNIIDKERKIKPVKITAQTIQKIHNGLIMNLHNISNAALSNLNVSPTAALITVKVRLFNDLAEIHTDVKSYIKNIHKYLNAFIIQNINTNIVYKIKNYSIKYNNLYCTIELSIPFKNNDGTVNNKFNLYDISSLLLSYINVIDTFTEQYKNII